MKINFSTIIRTNLGSPSEWKGKTVDDEDVRITYRFGLVKIFLNDLIINTLSLDEFDLGGYTEDSTLRQLLTDNDLI